MSDEENVEDRVRDEISKLWAQLEYQQHQIAEVQQELCHFKDSMKERTAAYERTLNLHTVKIAKLERMK